MRCRRWLVVVAMFSMFAVTTWAEVTREGLESLLSADVHGWLWKLGEVPGAEAPDFDDSDWEPVDIGFKWWPHDSTCWFRKAVTIPERINGIATQGAAVRLKVGVDNEAGAYVDGVFKQQFMWADGDFVLTENAEPGEAVSVALYAINRPGLGSLYQAYLVSEASEEMVEALRTLLGDFDAATSDAPYVPPEETAHWEGLVHDAMQTLDMEAYQDADTEAFLASVAKARAVLLSDLESLACRLDKTARNSTMLEQRIDIGRQMGLQLAYPQVDARVIESFLRYIREDVAEAATAHKIRGLKTATFLERLCRTALAAAAEPLEDPARDLRVPQYETGSLSIRDGAFRQTGRPVFFTGVGHFGQVRHDIPILTDYGLNIVQIEMGPRNALPDPDTVDEDAIGAQVVQWLDAAAEHNVAVNLLISPHYFPQWAWDSDPAHALCGHGFLKYCIEAPSTREVMEKWLNALMPLIAGHPALHSICLSNEPQYKGKCDYERGEFRKWLEDLHGTVEAMNTCYGTDFSSFQEVPIPEDISGSYALFFDWCRFNQDRFRAFHEMLRDMVHEYDPKLPVHAKVMSLAFEDPGRFEEGINFEDFNQIGRVAGNDCWYAFYGQQPNPYKVGWLTMAINYTLQHCTAPDSPIFNSENHLIADGDPRHIPAQHIRLAHWHQAIHGQGASTMWVWDRGQGGDLAENILTRANCVRALGRVALDLNRLAEEVYALQRARADLALFYSYSSLLPSADHTDQAKAAFEGAYFTDALCDIVTERQAEAGKLEQYKLVVVPRAAHIPDGVLEAFGKYIREGGTVMAVGSCFTHDEYGHARQGGLEQEGNGRLVVYPDPLTPQAYRDILNGLLEATHCARPVRLNGVYGEPTWGVNLRAVEHDGKLLASLINFTRDAKRIVLETEAPIRRAVNLFDNTDVAMPLTVEPLEPVLLELETGMLTQCGYSGKGSGFSFRARARARARFSYFEHGHEHEHGHGHGHVFAKLNLFHPSPCTRRALCISLVK